MIKINQCYLENYTFNEKESTPEVKPTQYEPGEGASISLDIKSIRLEEKTVLLKKLQVGQNIEFKLNQGITINVPNHKIKEYEDVNIDISGMGSGEILEVLEFDEQCEDEEYQDVEVVLNHGKAEFLSVK